MSLEAYSRRVPEGTVLYEVLQRELLSFLDSHGALPWFVRSSLERYLACGIMAHGFARFYCAQCKGGRLVAFSCKRRGFCPSCAARRMNSQAAHLVERVLGAHPVRQWVLSFPIGLRYLMAYDASLCAEVLRLSVREIFRHYRRSAKRRGQVPSMVGPRCGAVTFIQRFSSSLQLNVHFHILLLDGVYVEEEDGGLRFRTGVKPSTEDLQRVVSKVADKVIALLRQRGEAAAERIAESEPALSVLAASSVQGRAVTKSRRGRTLHWLYDPLRAMERGEPAAEVAKDRGFNLHAGVYIREDAPQRLERLCRYVARGPIATQRLTRTENGHVVYRFKRPWRDGRTAVVFSPQEFIGKLAALIPPFRVHQLRYHGVLAPNASWRPYIVPVPIAANDDDGDAGAKSPNYSWAELMKRVFDMDVLLCACGGRLVFIASIMEREAIQAILKAQGLPADPPEVAPAPQLDFHEQWGDDSEHFDAA